MMKKTTKKRFFYVLSALLVAVAVSCPAPSAMAECAPGSPCMYVETGNRGKLHLRSRPDSGSESLGLYRNGTRVLVEGFANGCWAAVLVNGRRGFMNMNYLTSCPPGQASALPARFSTAVLSCQNPAVRQQVTGAIYGAMKPMYVTCGSLHLRAYASQNAESLGLYPKGTQVYAADLGNGWSYVLVNGLYGCMMTRYLSPASETVCSNQNAWRAREYICCPQSAAVPQYVCSSQSASVTSWRIGSVVTVRNPNSTFVYLRSSKDSDRRDNILARVPVGAQAVLLEYGEYWSRILYEGIEGFMASRYLR